MKVLLLFLVRFLSPEGLPKGRVPLIISWEAGPEPEGSLPAKEIALVLGPPLLFCASCQQAVGPTMVHPPSCQENVFSEGQSRLAERWSVRRVMSSSCSQPSPTKEWSSSRSNSPKDRSSPCSATSARSLGKPNISPLGS
jgi:hypothetical protein